MTSSAQTEPVIETENLRLRAPVISDLKHYLEFANSERAHQFPSPTIAEPNWQVFAGMMAHWEKHSYGPFVMTRHDEETALGHAGVYNVNDGQSHEVGAAIWTSGYEGKSLAYEALDAAMSYYRQTYGWDNFRSRVHKKNDRSQRMTERLGARIDQDATSDDPNTVIYKWPGGPLHT